MIEIKLTDDSSRPDGDLFAKHGPRRIVKYIPMPGGYHAPAIWTSQLVKAEISEGATEDAYICVVLVAKEPKPVTAAITVPKGLYEKLHEGPVEW